MFRDQRNSVSQNTQYHSLHSYIPTSRTCPSWTDRRSSFQQIFPWLLLRWTILYHSSFGKLPKNNKLTSKSIFSLSSCRSLEYPITIIPLYPDFTDCEINWLQIFFLPHSISILLNPASPNSTLFRSWPLVLVPNKIKKWSITKLLQKNKN